MFCESQSFLNFCADDVSGNMPPAQGGLGGSIPTSALNLKSCMVHRVAREEIQQFVERWHYSKSINGLKAQYCFQLLSPAGEMIGVAIYGGMAMSGQYKRFSDLESDVIELRRLCCIDDTPKNTESYFIGKTIRWLKKNTSIKVIVSYADADHGHSGIIYKACNFEYLGFRKGGKIIVWNGKRYHDKAIRATFNGKPKPFAIRLRAALETGEAKYVPALGKHTFIYRLR